MQSLEQEHLPSRKTPTLMPVSILSDLDEVLCGTSDPEVCSAPSVVPSFPERLPGGDPVDPCDVLCAQDAPNPPASPEEIIRRLQPFIQSMRDMIPSITRDNPARGPGLLRQLDGQGLNPEQHVNALRAIWREIAEYMIRAYPNLRQELQLRLLPEPAGTPTPLPDGEGNPTRSLSPRFGFASPELHAALVSTGRLQVALTPDASVIFGTDSARALEELDRFYDATRWFISTGEALQQDQELAQATVLSEQFRQRGYGSGFQQPTIETVRADHPHITDQEELNRLLVAERRRYVPRAQYCFNALQMVHNYAQVILALHGQHGLTLEALNELRALGMNVEYDTGRREFTVFDFRSAIPNGIASGEANDARWDALRAWCMRHRPAVETATRPIQEAIQRALERNEDPRTAFLQWGHENIPGHVHVNGRREAYDFIDHDFTLSDLPGGRIRITRTRTHYRHAAIPGTAIRAGFYNFHRDQVGEPVVETIDVDRNQLIACINHFGEIEIVRAGASRGMAGSGLEGWRRGQMAMFGISRYGSMAVDLGLVVTGMIGARAAWAAGRVGAAAVHLGRATIGGMGAFSLSPEMENVRRVAILLDVGSQVFSRAIRGIEGLPRLSRNASWMRRAEYAVDWTAHRATWGGMLATSFIVGRHTLDAFTDTETNFIPGLRNAELGRRPPGDNRPLFDFANERMRTGTQAIFRDYMSHLFPGGNLPAEIREIQRNMERLMTRPENERQEYISQLMAHFRMDGAAIARLHQTLRSRTVTDNNCRDVDFAGTRQPNETQVAAALAILLLSVRPDGSLPDVLGTRDVTVPEWSFEERSGPVNPRTGERGLVTVRGGGAANPETVRQELRAADLLGFIRRYVTTDGAVTPQRLVTAEALWHFGAVSDAGLAGIYRDAIASGNRDLAMRAIAGAPNGVNLGLLIYEMQRQESAMADRPRQERDQFFLRRHGLTSNDILRFLQREVRPAGGGQDADLRAALITLHRSLNPSVSNSRTPELITHMVSLWREHGANPGQFATRLLAHVERDMARPAREPETAADAVRRRIRDAGILLDTGRITVAQYNDQLLPGLDERNPAQTLVVLNGLRWESMSVAQRTRVVDLLVNTPTTQQNEIIKLAILSRLRNLLEVTPQFRGMVSGNPEEALQPLRTRLSTYLRQTITPPADGGPRGNFAVIFEDMRAAAVQALAFMGGTDEATINALRGRLQFRERDGGGAFVEVSPQVRLATIEALYRLRPANLRVILDEYLRRETDARCAQRAREITREIGIVSTPDREVVNRRFQDILTRLLNNENFDWNHTYGNDNRTPARVFRSTGRPAPPGAREDETRAQTIDEWMRREWPLLFEAGRHEGLREIESNFVRLISLGSCNVWSSDARGLDRRIAETFNSSNATSIWGRALRGEMNAIRGLCWIVQTRGTSISNDQETRDIFVHVSASVLMSIAGENRGDEPTRRQVRGLILRLAAQPDLHPLAEQCMFLAIWRMSQPNEAGNTALSRTETAEALLTLLGKRIFTPIPVTPAHPGYEQIVETQLNCIQMLRRMYFRDGDNGGRFIAMLQALSDERVRRTNDNDRNRREGRTIDHRISDAARETLEYLMEGAYTYLHSTHVGPPPPPPDRTTPTLQRSQAIEQQLRTPDADYGNVVEAIFRAVHGLDDRDGRWLGPDDPLVRTLLRISMGSPPNQRLQLAASFALLRLKIGPGPMRRDVTNDLLTMQRIQEQADDIRWMAMNTLAHLAHNATLPSIRREALDMLTVNRAELERSNVGPTRQLEIASTAREGVQFFWQLVSNQASCNRPLTFDAAQEAALIRDVVFGRPPVGRDPVEAIVRACWGKRFVPDDPRLEALRDGMRNGSAPPRVRAICAILLVYFDGQRSGREAVQALAEIAGTTGVNATLRNDIAGFLSMAVPELRRSGVLPADGPPETRIVEPVPNGFRVRISGNRFLSVTRAGRDAPVATVVTP